MHKQRIVYDFRKSFLIQRESITSSTHSIGIDWFGYFENVNFIQTNIKQATQQHQIGTIIWHSSCETETEITLDLGKTCKPFQIDQL